MFKQFKEKGKNKVIKKSYWLALMVICLFSLSFISATSCGYGYSCSSSSTVVLNQTTTNVNNSQFLEDHPASYFYQASNPFGFYNSTSFDINNYYLKSNPYSYYNVTTLPATTEPLWNANYSTFLTKIDWTHAVNGTLALNSSLNNYLLKTEWNSTNTSYYLNSNPFGFYNSTTLPASNEVLWNANYSNYLSLFNWNKTYADGLYYGIGNSYGYYNSTNPQPMINTSYYLASNPFGFYNSTNFVITDYYLKSNPYSYYNVTTLPDLNSSGLIKDWNATGYIKNWNASGFISNQTQDLSPYLLKTEWNSTNTSYALNTSLDNYYLKSNPFSFYNSTNPQPVINTSYYLVSNPYSYYNITTAPIYLNDTFAGNYSIFLTHIDWTHAVNGTLALNSSLSNYYLNSNPFGFYNVTTAPTYVNDTFGANYSTYLSLFNLNKTYADTLYSNIQWNYNQTTPAINTILGFNYYNSTSLTTNSQLLNGNNYWNDTYATFNKTYSDTLYSPITEPLSLHLNQNNWNNDSAGYIYWDVSNARIVFNQTKLQTIFFNSSVISVVRGTGAGVIGNLLTYDDISYNVTEASGADGLDFRVNFTGIDSFNQIIFRYKSTAGESHTMNMQLWDYDSNSWQNYATLGEVTGYNIKEIGVFDEAEHIGSGVVQVRFYQSANGNTGHTHFFDWVTISEGLATPSGAEIDPLSFHKNENLDNTGYNITGSYIFGNGSQLTDVLKTETDPQWTDNFTKYNTTWSSITNTSYYLNSNPII